MKSHLFFILFFCLIVSAFSALSGGWKRGSFKENDVFIENAFRKAFEIYSEENHYAELDYLQRLTIYRQMVNGINYRMCFIDLKSYVNVVQEYIIAGPSFGQNTKDPAFNFFEKNTYTAKSENISVNDKRYPRIQNTLFGYLKKFDENILFINKIEIVETPFDNFYIIEAQGEKKEHTYVVGQSKENSDEYEGYGILK